MEAQLALNRSHHCRSLCRLGLCYAINMFRKSKPFKEIPLSLFWCPENMKEREREGEMWKRKKIQASEKNRECARIDGRLCALPGGIITVETSGNSSLFFYNKKNQTTSSWFLCFFISFFSPFLLKISRCYGGNLDLNFDGEHPSFLSLTYSSLYAGLSAGWSSLLDLSIWNDPSIHPSASAEIDSTRA